MRMATEQTVNVQTTSTPLPFSPLLATAVRSPSNGEGRRLDAVLPLPLPLLLPAADASKGAMLLFPFKISFS